METRLRMLIPYIEHWPRVQSPYPGHRATVFGLVLAVPFARRASRCQKLAHWSPETQGCSVRSAELGFRCGDAKESNSEPSVALEM